MWFFGIQVHLYTLAGIAISFGLMTDHAIVMIDYYHQYRNRRVFLALLAATLTTVAALLMILLLPENERKDLTDFVIIVSVALCASLVTALWFIPGLYRLVFKEKSFQRRHYSVQNLRKRVKLKQAYASMLAFLRRYRAAFMLAVILVFGLPVFLLPAEWKGSRWYNKAYNKTIGSEYYQSSLRPHADKWLGGTLYRFIHHVYDRSVFRDIQRTRLYVSAELAYGHTPEQMNHLLEYMEDYLRGVQGIEQFITHIYSGRYGSIEITFKPAFEHSALPYLLKSRLIAQSMNQSGADWNIYGVGQGFSNAGPGEIPNFRVIMKGYNYDELAHQAGVLAAMLQKHPRVRKINTDRKLNYEEEESKEYVLQFDPDAMASNNISSQQVVRQLRLLGKATYPATTVSIGHQFYPVIIQSQEADAFSAWQLMNRPLQPAPGHAVNLKHIAGLVLRPTASSIHKEDREYIRVVSFDYIGSYYLGDRYLEETLKQMKEILPVGYSAERSVNRFNAGKTARQYGLLLLIILVDFFICGVLFENLKQPFFIISTIPVSFIGVFLVFSLFDFSFDQGGYASFVMLAGIAVNASIFIANDFNNLKPAGKNYNRKLSYAICNRARTILLTIISTCCGLIPFLAGGKNEVFWFALAAGTIGGLVLSLFAVFILLPVLLWRKRM